MPNLGKFGRRSVVSTSIKVTKAGDGLSDALAVQPVVLEHDAEVFLVLKCRVDKVTHQPVSKDIRDLVRVHVLATEEATIVEESLVAAALEQQRNIIAEYTEDDDDDGED